MLSITRQLCLCKSKCNHNKKISSFSKMLTLLAPALAVLLLLIFVSSAVCLNLAEQIIKKIMAANSTYRHRKEINTRNNVMMNPSSRYMKEIRKVLGGSSGELCNCGEDTTCVKSNKCRICNKTEDCTENEICLAAGPGHGTAAYGKCVYNII